MKYKAIVDLGSSKVVTLIAEENRKDPAIQIRGQQTVQHSGLRKAGEEDIVALRSAVIESLELAQEQAKVDVGTFTMSVPGLYSEMRQSKGRIFFEEPRILRDEDIQRMSQQSMEQIDTTGLIHLHSIPLYFILDGEKIYDLPENRTAMIADGEFMHIFVKESFVDLAEEIFCGSDYHIERYVDAIFAEMLSIVPENDLSKEAVLIDVGGYQTDICIVRSHAPVYREQLPVGGWHLSNDLQYVLEVDRAAAESLKRHYVYGLNYESSNETCRMQDGSLQSISNATVQEIIDARTEEMAQFMVEAIKKAPDDLHEETPIYFTGGGLAPMRGSDDFLQKFFAQPLKMCLPGDVPNNQFQLSSAFAVLQYISGGEETPANAEEKPSSIWQRILHFFTE